MTSHKFRKIPIEIEAYQLTGKNFRSSCNLWPTWLQEAWEKKAHSLGSLYVVGDILLETLEGPLKVSIDDWIIRGIDYELYPCKPEIFNKTYEKVE